MIHISITEPNVEDLVKKVTETGDNKVSKIWELNQEKPHRLVFCEIRSAISLRHILTATNKFTQTCKISKAMAMVEFDEEDDNIIVRNQRK